MPDSICRRLTELRVQHERWAAPDSKASNGQIKDSRSILFLCQALEAATDALECIQLSQAEPFLKPEAWLELSRGQAAMAKETLDRIAKLAEGSEGK